MPLDALATPTRCTKSAVIGHALSSAPAPTGAAEPVERWPPPMNRLPRTVPTARDVRINLMPLRASGLVGRWCPDRPTASVAEWTSVLAMLTADSAVTARQRARRVLVPRLTPTLCLALRAWRVAELPVQVIQAVDASPPACPPLPQQPRSLELPLPEASEGAHRVDSGQATLGTPAVPGPGDRDESVLLDALAVRLEGEAAREQEALMDWTLDRLENYALTLLRHRVVMVQCEPDESAPHLEPAPIVCALAREWRTAPWHILLAIVRELEDAPRLN